MLALSTRVGATAAALMGSGCSRLALIWTPTAGDRYEKPGVCPCPCPQFQEEFLILNPHMSPNRCLASPDPALQSLGSTWDLYDALLEAAIATATEQEGRGTGRFQTLKSPTACREVPRIPASTCSKSQNVIWKDGDAELSQGMDQIHTVAQTAELQGAVRRGRGSPRPVTASASRLQQPHHRAQKQCWEHMREKGFQRGQNGACSEGGIVRNSPEVRAEGAPGLGLLWPEVSPCWSRGRRAERSCPRLTTALILILLLCLGYRGGKGAGNEVEPGKKRSPPFF